MVLFQCSSRSSLQCMVSSTMCSLRKESRQHSVESPVVAVTRRQKTLRSSFVAPSANRRNECGEMTVRLAKGKAMVPVPCVPFHASVTVFQVLRGIRRARWKEGLALWVSLLQCLLSGERSTVHHFRVSLKSNRKSE